MEDISLNDLKKLVSKRSESIILKEIGSGSKLQVGYIQHLDDDLYELLPPILRIMVGNPEYKTKRDLRLLGILVVISGVLPNLIGLYDNTEVKPNLNLFVTGPFAAGKGELNKLKHWVDLIQKYFEEQFKEEMIQYREAIAAGDEDAKHPILKWLFIPADNSKSGFIELLAQSDGRGILMETEADTLTSSFSLEFGNYSDVLRKVYHHETVSFYRRTNKEKIEIEQPCLSVLIGGTFDQFKKMFFNSSNGLLSRFLVYNVRPIDKFKNVFSVPEQNIKQSTVISLKKFIYDNYLNLSNLEAPVFFELSVDQQQLFVEYFSGEKKIVSGILDEEDAGFINRLALNVYKIMMILTSIRSLDEDEIPSKYICTDEDFYCAIKIYEMLREHFFYSFSELLQDRKAVHHDKELLKGRIHSMKAQGYSFRKIHKMLGVPLPTVHRYYKGY